MVCITILIHFRAFNNLSANVHVKGGTTFARLFPWSRHLDLITILRVDKDLFTADVQCNTGQSNNRNYKK